MSTSDVHVANPSKWLTWKPKVLISASNPTKPSKLGFAGFVGAICAESQKIEAERSTADLEEAIALINRTGTRIVPQEGRDAIGIWSDLDGPEVRAALCKLGAGHLPILYLDSAQTPIRYKVSRVRGEPVPLVVLQAMEEEATEPWRVRDEMVNKMGRQSKDPLDAVDRLKTWS